MNYKLKQFFVWCSVAVVVTANLCLVGWMFKDLVLSYFFREFQTIEQINDRYLTETSLEHEIVDFLQLFYHKRTKESDIFLIDHQMLLKYLSKNEVDSLIESGNLPANALTPGGTEKQRFVTFGIFKSKMKNIKNTLQYLLSIGWEIKVDTANGKYIHSVNPIEPQHLFFAKRSVVIHLAVFYPRDDYFWVGGFSSKTARQLRAERWYNLTSIMYGHYSAIFDRFKLQYRFMMAMPEDVSYFITQQRTSKFIECNHEHVHRFAILHGDWLYTPQNLEIAVKSIQDALSLIQQLSKWLRTDIWIFHGTLLSWFRSCAPFIYQNNLDFALSFERVKHLNLTAELIQFAEFHSNGKLFVNNILGLQKKGIEYRLQLVGSYLSSLSHIHLVLCYDQEKNTTISLRYAMYESQKEVFQTVLDHPQSEVCSAAYLGHKVLIPCKAAETVLNEFGPDWQVPMIKWDNIFSPVNRVNQSTLPKHSIEYYEAVPIPDTPYLTYGFYVILALIFGLVMRFKSWQIQKKHI